MKRAATITIKVLLGTLCALVLLFIITILLIRLPSVQNYITHKVVSSIAEKTHSRVELKHVYITFPKSVVIEGLYAEDVSKDTLLYLGKLKVDVDMFGLLKKKVNVNSLYLGDVNAKIIRNTTDSTFNFDFLVRAFAGKKIDKPEAVKEEKKDTSGWQIGVGKVELENIRGAYVDGLTSTDIYGAIGSLKLKMNSIDIRSLNFKGNELSLSDTRASVIINNKSVKEAVDTVRSLLPSLALDKVTLKNVHFLFEHTGQSMVFNVGNLVAWPEEIELNKQLIRVKSLSIDSTDGALAFLRNEDSLQVSKENASDKSVSPQGWRVSADSLNFKKVNFKYDFTNVPKLTYGVDYSHLDLKDISLNISNASYSNELVKADIHSLSAKEQSGFVLNNLTAHATYSNTGAELAGLSLTTPQTRVSNHLAIRYASISTLGKDIGAMGLTADLQNTRVAINDLLLLVPMLKKQAIFNNMAGKSIAVNGKIQGQLKDVSFNNLTVQAPGSTYISLSGHINGLPDAMNAVYDVDLHKLNTTKTDLQTWVGDKLPSSINLPAKIDLAAKVKGSFRNIHSSFNLQTSSGSAVGEASLKRLDGDTSYSAKLSTKDLDLGYILKKDSLLGPVTAEIDLSGKNLSIATLQADADAKVESIKFKGYTYSNINLKASDSMQVYKVDMTVNDKALIMDMKADVSLLKEQESVKVDLNLEGANLYELKLVKQDLRVSGKLNADLQGTIDNLNGQAGLNDVVVIKGEDIYRIGSFAALSVNDKKHSAVKINSGIVNADYKGSVKVAGVTAAVKNYIDHYFDMDGNKARVYDTSAQDFSLRVTILPHPLINGVILPELEKFNGAEVSVDFDNAKQKLDVVTEVTGIKYKGNALDNMNAEVHGDNKDLKYSIAFDRFKSGNINLAETNMDGTVRGDSIDFSLKIHDRDSADKLLMAGIFLQDTPKSFMLRLDNNKLVFANQKWSVPEDNFVHFGSSGFYAHRLDITNNNQQLSINSERDDPAAPIKIVFKQFELGTISQVVEKDTGLIRGQMNGTVELRNLQTAAAFVSDLKMTNVAYKDNAIGDIQVKADNLTTDKYTAQVVISGADNDVKIDGYFAPGNSDNQLNFKANLNRLQLHSVEGFTNGQLRETSGYLTGDLSISGKASQPVITGDIRFKDVGANVAYLNNYFSLKDEHIKIDAKGVYLNNFRILDANGQKATINGSVLTSDFKNMKFDLSATTYRFRVMNTSVADNPLYFGEVILDSRISIKGDNQLPIMHVDAKLIDGSNITVIVPTSKISVDRGEGVVVLVDTTGESGIMSQADTVPVPISFKGINLTANLEVNKATSFKVIVDKTSNDSLVVRGDGMLSFSMDETGRQSLTGTYVLSSGGYRASFQGVIRKEFLIQDGSTITWNGRPTDATVNITALYKTRTSAADLLSSDLAASTTEERNVYRKPLHFMVLMNMQGALLKPVISFKLDMEDQDKDAFGGTVYAKINSVNNDQNELNKQVFSLLILNSFMPTGTGGGDAGTTATNLARNSVNQILTDQLNNLSGRIIKGVDVNFGIQSNDDYTTGGVQQRTELSVGVKKEFFHERLSVQVGSSINVEDNTGAVTQNSGSNIPADFIIEYKITPDGRYRFKAFRQNQYESLIDGLLYKTGVGIVYTRDYDTFKELLHKPVKDEPPKENLNP